jgi:hypothetical protein
MWLAIFVCAPQFFKTPMGLYGHTVIAWNSLHTLNFSYVWIWNFCFVIDVVCLLTVKSCFLHMTMFVIPSHSWNKWLELAISSDQWLASIYCTAPC